MIVFWDHGEAFTSTGQSLGRMTLDEAATLAAEQGDQPGDLVFVRLGRPERRDVA